MYEYTKNLHYRTREPQKCSPTTHTHTAFARPLTTYPAELSVLRAWNCGLLNWPESSMLLWWFQCNPILAVCFASYAPIRLARSSTQNSYLVRRASSVTHCEGALTNCMHHETSLVLDVHIWYICLFRKQTIAGIATHRPLYLVDTTDGDAAEISVQCRCGCDIIHIACVQLTCVWVPSVLWFTKESFGWAYRVVRRPVVVNATHMRWFVCRLWIYANGVGIEQMHGHRQWHISEKCVCYLWIGLYLLVGL